LKKIDRDSERRRWKRRLSHRASAREIRIGSLKLRRITITMLYKAVSTTILGYVISEAARYRCLSRKRCHWQLLACTLSRLTAISTRQEILDHLARFISRSLRALFRLNSFDLDRSEIELASDLLRNAVTSAASVSAVSTVIQFVTFNTSREIKILMSLVGFLMPSVLILAATTVEPARSSSHGGALRVL